MKYLKNITGLVLAVTMCTSMHAPILAAEEDNQVEKYNPTYEDLQDAEYYKYYDKDGYPVNNEEIMMQMLIMMMERCWQGLLLHRIQSLDVTCRNGREEMMEI